MAQFLTTVGTAHELENIIRGAKDKLFLITPFLQLSKNHIERLKDADRRGVKITIIFRGEEVWGEQRGLLAQMQNLKAFSIVDLHAKCYFNEDRMVIGSMNLYDYSEKNNREMGVLVLRSNDEELFRQASDEASSIQAASREVFLTKSPNVDQGTNSKTGLSDEGFCIRCHRRKNYENTAPFCRDCYYVWVEFGNPDYVEQFCHSCGKDERTSMNRPLCSTCYGREISRSTRTSH